MVNKIIADSLKAGKRLVIPQFGAFIHKDTDGGVVFVPFLKKDDGVLAAQLSSVYGLSNEEAYSVINEYIAQVQRSVADRGSFVVEGVGRLLIDSNGVCYLDYNPQEAVEGAPASAPVRPAAVPGVAAPTAQPLRPQPTQPVQPVQSAQPVPQPQQPRPVQQQQPVQPRPPMPQPSQTQAVYGQPGAVQPSQSPQPPQSQQPQAAQPQGQPYPNQQFRQQAPRGQYAPGQAARGGQPAQKGTDKFLVIAILAAIVALGAIIFGVVTASNSGPKIDPMEIPVHQRAAILDTIQKQDSIRMAEEAAKAAKTKPKTTTKAKR